MFRNTYLARVKLTNDLPIAQVNGVNDSSFFYLKRFVAFPDDFNNLDLYLTIKRDGKIIAPFECYPMELLIDYERVLNTKAIDLNYHFSNFKNLHFEVGSYSGKKFEVSLVFPKKSPDWFN